MEQEKDLTTEQGSFELKVGLAEMLKGGVIIDVTTEEQAKVAEEAGAVAVMALECICDGEDSDTARMSNLELIQSIQKAVSIPVMAKCRIGHFVEAQILETLFVDFIDESERLTPVDEQHYIDKHNFRIPFVCGAEDLGEALRRIEEGAAMIRLKTHAGRGNISQAVKQMRAIQQQIRKLFFMDQSQLMSEAKKLLASLPMLKEVAETKKLPVPIFAEGGIVSPADAAIMMQLGAESVFVGSTIFKSEDPIKSAKAIVAAVTYYKDPEMLAKASMGLLTNVKSSDSHQVSKEELLAPRGW